MTDNRHRPDSTHKRTQRELEPMTETSSKELKRTGDTLEGIRQRLDNVGNQIAGIYINEVLKQEVIALKEQLNGIQKDLKKYKRMDAQITDLNRELHDFNKWRLAVEKKIGEVVA